MAESNKIRLLAIVGPTASGKSSLAVKMAKALGGEVISCDSMQIYRRMDIGTAKPTKQEMEGIAHHLIDCIEPDSPFSCADYVDAAGNTIAELCEKKKLPILCGGTGLYLDSLLRGSFEDTASDPALRQALWDQALQYGNHVLHQRLAEVDPESAAAIHENNLKRVIRALEIYELTGETKTALDRRSQTQQSPYDATVIGLRYADRELLYERIDRRVEQMLEAGLLDETRRLLDEGIFEKNTTAAQAIGYKELLGYLRGERSLSESIEALKTATRRYAKRQITWFGAKDYVRWIDVVREGKIRPFDEILEEAIGMATDRSTV